MKSSACCAAVASLALLLAGSAWAGPEAAAPEAALVIVTSRSFAKAGAGNGFVVGDGTLVVTCDHAVMERSDHGEHRMEAFVGVFSPYLGEACSARIVASDPELDLAVLEVPWEGHPSLFLADANEVLSARRARVMGRYATVHRLGDWDSGAPEAEPFQVDQEERPLAFVGVRKENPRVVVLDGSGQMGRGWSGSPMLLPGTSTAVGCMARIDKIGVGHSARRERASGPAASQVRSLLGEAFQGRVANTGRVCLKSSKDAREVCALALRADSLIQREQYESAREAAHAFVQHRPESAFAHKMLAYASEHVGQAEAARAEYGRALKLDPNDLNIQLLYAQFLGTQNEPNAALQILEPLWRSGRSHDLVGIALVSLLGQRKEWARCGAILEEVVQSHPRNAHLWQQMGACRLQAQGPAAALAPISRAVELFPERGPYRGGLARLLEMTGAFDEAENHFRKLLEVEPENPVVYCWLAEFLSKHHPQAREEAVKVAEKALSLPPRPGLPREKIEEMIRRIREPASSTAPE